MCNTVITCPFKVTIATNGQQSGIFEGYGAVSDNTDFYGDVIRKGVFQKSLSYYRDNNLNIPMRVMHGFDDTLPVEDDYRLKLTGRLSAMNTEKGIRHLKNVNFI